MQNRGHITADFINYCKNNLATHSHFEITVRVLECLDYIEDNLGEIASQAGKVSLLRHPVNHLAFHLNGLNTPREVIDTFSKLISEVHGCLSSLLTIENTSIRNQIISIFLNHINDSDVGCMEIRLRNALTFYGKYQSVGLISLNNLMQEFYESRGGVKNNLNIPITVENMLSFFADKVDLHLLVMNNENQIVRLTWPLIHDYIETILCIDNFKDEWMQFAAKEPTLVLPQKRRKTWHTYYFESEQKANQYISYIKSILPSLYKNELVKISVKKDKQGQYYIRLTTAQHTSFNNIIHQYIPSAELEREKENVVPSKTTDNPTSLAKAIAAKFKNEGALVKSVRFDNRCFNLKCIDGLTKSPVKQVIEDQRKLPHKKYTVFATGVYERSEKPSPYIMLTPEETAEKKKERSTFQATSLVTPKAQIPVFGHRRHRTNKLVGYLFDPNDVMINRMFIYDGGTVERPYEFDTYEEALAYYEKTTNPDHPILFSSMEEFKKAIASQKNKYNEVLARVRWQMSSSAIGIFSDTFEARCIAQLYARQLRDRLKLQHQELGKSWDDSYQVPIIYYIPGSDKNWEPYTESEQLADRQYAERIFQDEKLRAQACVNNNYEFLLLLNNPDEILNLKLQGSSNAILIDLLCKGKLQLVESLLYRTSLNEQEIQQYFRTGLANIKSLPIINKKTGSTALHLAAELGHSTLKLFLVNKKLNIDMVDKKGITPLHYAARYGSSEAVEALLRHWKIKVNIHDGVKGWTPLHYAARYGHTEVVKTLLRHPKIKVNTIDDDYETALMQAAAFGHIETVKVLLGQVDVNITNEQGMTALMLAAYNGHIETVLAMLTYPHIDINTTYRSLDMFMNQITTKVIGSTEDVYKLENLKNFLDKINKIIKIKSFLKNTKDSFQSYEIAWAMGDKESTYYMKMYVASLLKQYTDMLREEEAMKKQSVISPFYTFIGQTTGMVTAKLKTYAAQKIIAALLYEYEQKHNPNLNPNEWLKMNKNIFSFSNDEELALIKNDPGFFSHDELVALKGDRLGEIISLLDQDQLPKIYKKSLLVDEEQHQQLFR